MMDIISSILWWCKQIYLCYETYSLEIGQFDEGDGNSWMARINLMNFLCLLHEDILL